MIGVARLNSLIDKVALCQTSEKYSKLELKEVMDAEGEIN